MENKNISTALGTIIIVIIAVTVCLFIWKMGLFSNDISWQPQNNQLPINNKEKEVKPVIYTEGSITDWRKFTSKELGISFEFPPVSGEYSYSYNEFPNQTSDPAGTFLTWDMKIIPEGYTFWFAGAASKDATAGRDRWITDNYKLLFENGEYKIQQADDYSYSISPLKVITRSDGLKGVIFDPNKDFPLFSKNSHGPINPAMVDRAAILNFPENYHHEIKSITFYFYFETSLENIEKVIRSVQFNK